MKAELSFAKFAIGIVFAASLALSGCATAVTSSNDSGNKAKEVEASKKSSDGKSSAKSAKKSGEETSRRQVTLFDRIFRGRNLTDKGATTGSTSKDEKTASSRSRKSNEGKKEAGKLEISKRSKAEQKAAKAELDKKKKDIVKEANIQTASLQQLPSTIDARGPVTRTGEVYLFRGLANVFSRGMDVMGRKLVRKGLDARVYNHSRWMDVANNIIARDKKGMVSYPIIIMGHSLGANASTHMARYLGDRGIKVTYVVSFDPTITTYVGSNIRQVTNYYLPNSKANNIVVKRKGFAGKLRNVNMSGKNVGHLNIEKNYKLQSDSINRIMDVTRNLPKSKRS